MGAAGEWPKGMNRPMYMRGRQLAVVAASVGVLTGHPRPSEAAPTGFQVGEGFAYNLSVGAIQAGQARMAVGAPTVIKGRRLLTVQGEAKSAAWLALIARLEDDYKAVIDADTLVTRTVSVVERGLRDRRLDVVAERTGNVARVILDIVKPNQPKRHELHQLSGTPLDPMAALFTMRAAPLVDGDQFEMLAFDGPAFYQTKVRVGGREPLERQGRETVPTIRVELVATRVDDRGKPNGSPIRRGTIWFSDDDRRVPYKVAGDTDFGRAELELVAYRPGKPPAPPHRVQATMAPMPVPPVRLE